MSDVTLGNRLDRPVDDRSDHVLGASDAAITLVEYGSYACPYCRAANERIAEVRDQFGGRMRYVFRHRPLVGVELARRAAELVERAEDPKDFWDAHIKLMTRSETLTEDDVNAVARDLASAPIAVRRTIRRLSARRRGSTRTRPAPPPAGRSSPRPSSSMAAAMTGHGTKARLPMRCWARSVIGCARRRSISPAGDHRRAPSSCSRQSSPSP